MARLSASASCHLLTISISKSMANALGSCNFTSTHKKDYARALLCATNNNQKRKEEKKRIYSERLKQRSSHANRRRNPQDTRRLRWQHAAKSCNNYPITVQPFFLCVHFCVCVCECVAAAAHPLTSRLFLSWHCSYVALSWRTSWLHFAAGGQFAISWL